MNGDTEYIFGEQHLFYDRSYIRHFSEVYAGTPTLNRPLKAKEKTVLNKVNMFSISKTNIMKRATNLKWDLLFTLIFAASLEISLQ